jgi:hypothetical protein
MLPKDFPAFTTVQGYFYDWRDNGLFENINFELLLQAEPAAGHKIAALRQTFSADRELIPIVADRVTSSPARSARSPGTGGPVPAEAPARGIRRPGLYGSILERVKKSGVGWIRAAEFPLAPPAGRGSG